MSSIEVGDGIGLPWILTIIFMVLKLTGNIAWSWLWVFSPLWITASIIILISVIIISVTVILNKKG